MAMSRTIERVAPPLLATALMLASASAVRASTIISSTRALPPVPGKSVDVGPVDGHVLVTLPGERPMPLRAERRIPLGSTVDASRGTVVITAAGTRGQTYAGEVSGGPLQVLQSASTPGVTELRLTGQPFTTCPSATAATVPPHSGVRVKYPPHRRGRAASASTVATGFRTVGRNGSGENEGAADWETVDSCGGTQIRPVLGTINAAVSGDARPIVLAPGQTWTSRCGRSGQRPVSTGYCAYIDSFEHPSGLVDYVAGLATKSAANQADLCVTPPTSVMSCATWAASPPDFDGYRHNVVQCFPAQTGDQVISWRIRASLSPTPPCRITRRA